MKAPPPGPAARPAWQRWLRLILAAGISLYLLLPAALSVTYVEVLLHLPCAEGMPAHPLYQPVSITSSDGIVLRGWWSPPENGAVIILMPGAGGGRDDLLAVMERLTARGYGALSLEGRNCAGALLTLGGREAQDVIAGLEFALSQPGVQWVGGLGFSAGSAALLMAAAQDGRIRAVVAQGNYANLLDEFTNSQPPPLSWEWWINHEVALYFWLRTGIWPGDLSPVDAVSRISPRPVLFIFGELEAQNARGMEQYQAAGEPKDFWLVPGVGHGGYLQAFPEEYTRRIISFFDQARGRDGRINLP